MRSATSGTTTPRVMWKPSVPEMLEKLEGCMTDVLAMLKEVKEAVSTGQVVDQCSAEKKVEDPADELREMAESRAKAWLAENSAADAWMAELKEFEESRESSSGTESMLTCSEIEVLAEERTHAGIVFPGMLKTEHVLSMSRERSSVRQGTEEPEGAHLAVMVTCADMELDGTHLAATEEAKQMLKHHTESLKDLAGDYDMDLKSQREAQGKMDAMIWDGLKDAKDESDSQRVRLEQVESQVTQLLERIKGEIRAEAPDATSAADTRAQEWHITLDERVTADGREGSCLLKAAGGGCEAAEGQGGRLRLPPRRRVSTPSADWAAGGKARY